MTSAQRAHQMPRRRCRVDLSRRDRNGEYNQGIATTPVCCIEWRRANEFINNAVPSRAVFRAGARAIRARRARAHKKENMFEYAPDSACGSNLSLIRNRVY